MLVKSKFLRFLSQRKYQNPLKQYRQTLDTIKECDCYEISNKSTKAFCKNCACLYPNQDDNSILKFINDIVFRF